MIVARHAPVDLFALVPKLMLDFEPELRELDRLLDDDEIVRGIAADVATRAHARVGAMLNDWRPFLLLAPQLMVPPGWPSPSRSWDATCWAMGCATSSIRRRWE